MTILQSLDRYYGRLAARGDVVLPGYSVEPIGFVIALSPDGRIAAVEIRHDPSGKKPKPERVPKWFGRQGTGSTPYFLWDNTAYALGVSTKDAGKTAHDHAAFKMLHMSALADETDEGLSAFRSFVETWTCDRFTAPLFDVKMLAWNVAFRLDGELRLLHDRPAAAMHIERLRVNVVPSNTRGP